MTDNGYKIAGIEQFRPQAETVQLPSQRGTDYAVKLMRPDLVKLIRGDGEIPDVLTNLVLTQIGGTKQDDIEINRETVPEMVEALDVIAVATFVEPKLVLSDEAEGDALPVSWLSFEDKAFVISWALGAEYVPAQRFPEEPGAGVEPVSKVQKVRGKSK